LDLAVARKYPEDFPMGALRGRPELRGHKGSRDIGIMPSRFR
jgi:hypothetical protein